MTTSVMPPLIDVVLDLSQLDQLLVDLEQLAEHLEVTAKLRPHSLAHDILQVCDLRAAIIAGARHLQLRYEYQGQAWCDTLVPLVLGQVRLIRINTTEAIAAAAPTVKA